VKHPLASFLSALAIVAFAAAGTALSGVATAAGTDLPVRFHAAVGSGLLSDPNIPLSCPTASPLQPVSFTGIGSGGLDARGSMSMTTIELGSCTRITVTASVECLLVAGSDAVLLGRVSSVVPRPRYPFNLFAIAVHDNGPAGDSGKLIPLNLPPPASCAEASLPLYFGFGFWPFATGGVTVL